MLKNMKKIFGIYSIMIVLIVLPLFYLSFYHDGSFIFNKNSVLSTFMYEKSLGIFWTVMAAYIASLTFFTSILISIQEKYEEEVFTKTIAGLKEDVSFLFFIALLHYIFLHIDISTFSILGKCGILALIILFFFTPIYMAYNLLSTILGLPNKLKKND